MSISSDRCPFTMSAVDLSKAFLFLTNKGFNPITGKQILTPLQCRHLNALLLMSATYEASGGFVLRIGLPGKKGVSGGISVNVPGKISTAVWLPAINKLTMSVAKLEAPEHLIETVSPNIFRYSSSKELPVSFEKLLGWTFLNTSKTD